MLIELTEHKKHMKEHKKEKKQLQDELMILQQTIREHQLPVIILFEGWSFRRWGIHVSDEVISVIFMILKIKELCLGISTRWGRDWLNLLVARRPSAVQKKCPIQ